MKLMVERVPGSMWWHWNYPSGESTLLQAVQRYASLFARGVVDINCQPQYGAITALIDLTQGELIAMADSADATLRVITPQPESGRAYFTAHHSVSLLGLCETIAQPIDLARACLPLGEAALHTAWQGRFSEDLRPFEALEIVRLSCDTSADTNTADLPRAAQLASGASGAAYDGYSDGIEMTVWYWTVAAAASIEELIKIRCGEQGAARRFAELAAKACEPSDIRQDAQQRKHLELLGELATWLESRKVAWHLNK